ncbi:hypothetical protein A6V39_03690 [Candidatus Mycoplasma haematobovis]|uniref:Uncharacterized protein n=1 Tax=Candidatus Mycoplasma haematobovis TaxID=432608 RepID=A0A1A9QE55_9MOLU|nr:hypothetical protein [Candidatus Mycoplasma haematobovis]OAL09989.1 hypothetical protein A6V39_03690 [Candidatus Mycoplasma haematobovis]
MTKFQLLNSSTPKTSSIVVATIRSKITEETGKKILAITAKGWDIKFHTYTSLTNKVKVTPNTEEGLKIWCTNTLDSNFSEGQNDIYLQAKQICTLPTSREKLLKDKKVIATGEDWQGRATAYTTEGINDLVILELKGNKKPTKKEIEDWCNKALEKEIEEGQDNTNLTLKWCTKTGA